MLLVSWMVSLYARHAFGLVRMSTVSDKSKQCVVSSAQGERNAYFSSTPYSNTHVLCTEPLLPMMLVPKSKILGNRTVFHTS